MKKVFWLNVFLILSLLGVIISTYLVFNHYNPPAEGAFCDLTETASCSLVNTSVFSELFNVPVALLGAFWFIILALLSFRAKVKNGAFILGLVIWSILGILFTIYMIIAEFLLKAICPLCTILHIFILFMLIISILLLRKERIPKQSILLKKWKPFIVITAILFLIPFILFNLPRETKDYTDFTKCLDEKGVKMYGSFRCGICAKTRILFGEAFDYIEEIECHPRGKNPQTELCEEKKVKRTPLWVREVDGKELARADG